MRRHICLEIISLLLMVAAARMPNYIKGILHYLFTVLEKLLQVRCLPLPSFLEASTLQIFLVSIGPTIKSGQCCNPYSSGREIRWTYQITRAPTQLKDTNKWGVTRFPPLVRNRDLFLVPSLWFIYPLLGLSTEKYFIFVCYAFKCDQMHILYVY